VPGFFCDLHIHSALSPCGALEMSPRNIVERAREAGLDLIAVTDHNMTENSLAAHVLGARTGLVVLFGMELQTEEEVHVLAIFDDYDVAYAFQEEIYSRLPPVRNDPDFFGDQVVVDADDEIVRFEERLLLNSARISISDASSWIKARGGLVIPAHIDSPTFSVLSQLGYVPDNVPFDALEVRRPERLDTVRPLTANRTLPFVTFSDAHYVKDIGRRRIRLNLDRPECRSIEGALKALTDDSHLYYQ
jgi:3',5'-nucleoside bisphosphate phosphatase